MKKNNHRLTNILLAISLAIVIFGAGFKIGEYKSNFGSVSPGTVVTNPNNINFDLFWETWNELQQKYVDQKKIDPQNMYYGAIKGMVASVNDPYTFFLTPDENKQTKGDLAGKFEGIGAELGLVNNQIVIIAPLKKSPAELAGVRAGDVITKVDDVSTQGWTLSQAVAKIRGPKGSKVKLTLERDSQELNITIVRDQITVASIDLSYEGNVAILKLNQFGETTNSEWDKAATEIADKWNKKEIKGMVLDLRGNPGGYLDSSVYIASDFLPMNKLVVKQESTVDGNHDYLVDRQGRLLNIPVSVLIDRGSASAAEILSGALQDYKRAKLIGEKSFGKGSVQEALDLSNGAGLHVTVAKWVLPNGTWINGKGIEPDIKVTLDIKDGNTLTRATDKQLDAAIGALNK